MFFTLIIGIAGSVFSAIYYGAFPAPSDIFTGFILGVLIDFYNLYKDKK
jgi:hypothetical protein